MAFRSFLLLFLQFYGQPFYRLESIYLGVLPKDRRKQDSREKENWIRAAVETEEEGSSSNTGRETQREHSIFWSC